MRNTFFTADHHFDHMNKHGGIITYCNRPYSNIKEMNESLISNWNSKVKPNDLVYHLGDFAFGNKNRVIELTKILNGTIILIEGSHDKNIGNAQNYGFHSKHKRIDIKINGIYISLNHTAMRVWEKSHYNSWHLYGHSHGCLDPIGKSWDVGVDNCNYEPLEFEEIKIIMDKQPDNFNLVRNLPEFDKKIYEEDRKIEMN